MADEENAYTFATSATQHITLTNLPAGGLKMWRGGRLPEITLAYESWGQLSAAADNAILIFTGLSPSAHALQRYARIIGYIFGYRNLVNDVAFNQVLQYPGEMRWIDAKHG